MTRAELHAHLNPIKEDIHEIQENTKDLSQIRNDVSAIRAALGAGPKWLGARANAVIDKVLPVALALLAVWLLGEKL